MLWHVVVTSTEQAAPGEQLCAGHRREDICRVIRGGQPGYMRICGFFYLAGLSRRSASHVPGLTVAGGAGDVVGGLELSELLINCSWSVLERGVKRSQRPRAAASHCASQKIRDCYEWMSLRG
jgi:hypothetical protein